MATGLIYVIYLYGTLVPNIGGTEKMIGLGAYSRGSRKLDSKSFFGHTSENTTLLDVAISQGLSCISF